MALALVPHHPHPPQVSMKVPEATVTLPIFVGNIAVNHAPVSPGPGLEPPAGTSPPLVPSAPPQEEAEGVAGGPHLSGLVSLCTKSHSQQQLPPAALCSVSVAPEPCAQGGSPAPRPPHPPLCVSTGATVPYFAEGFGGPVPASSALILPPEYSSWGYPYGEWEGQGWRWGRRCHGPLQTQPSPHRGPAFL